MIKKLTEKEVLDATPEDEKDEVLAILEEAFCEPQFTVDVLEDEQKIVFTAKNKEMFQIMKRDVIDAHKSEQNNKQI